MNFLALKNHYIAFILLIVAGTLIIPYALRVWRDVKEGVDEGSSDPEDILGPLTDAYAAGEMDREEYERIRDSVLNGSMGNGGDFARKAAKPGEIPPKENP